MLFAYAISGDTLLSTEALDELRAAAAHIESEHMPSGSFGFDWESLAPETRVEGTFLRGYQHVGTRTETLEVALALQALSARFPQYMIYMSGAGDLPMTQLVAGEFELFAETYERALDSVRVTIERTARRARA